MIYRLIKAMVGTDGYGSQAHGYPKTNRNAGSRLAQPRFGREESIKERWHDLGIDALPGAEPRCGCAQLPNRTMFPPSPEVTMLFDADYGGIQAPRISNKPAVHRLFSSLLFSSPRLLL